MTSEHAGDRGQGGPASADGAAEPDRPASVVLELVIAGTEPLSGTVGLAGSGPRRAFHGWIDLMSIIGALHSQAERDPLWPA